MPVISGLSRTLARPPRAPERHGTSAWLTESYRDPALPACAITRHRPGVWPCGMRGGRQPGVCRRTRHDKAGTGPRSPMQQEPSARVVSKSDIEYRLLVPFLLHVTLTQTLILIIRITTSYRAIELGLPVIWLGIIATG